MTKCCTLNIYFWIIHFIFVKIFFILNLLPTIGPLALQIDQVIDIVSATINHFYSLGQTIITLAIPIIKVDNPIDLFLLKSWVATSQVTGVMSATFMSPRSRIRHLGPCISWGNMRGTDCQIHSSQ